MRFICFQFRWRQCYLSTNISASRSHCKHQSPTPLIAPKDIGCYFVRCLVHHIYIGVKLVAQFHHSKIRLHSRGSQRILLVDDLLKDQPSICLARGFCAITINIHRNHSDKVDYHIAFRAASTNILNFEWFQWRLYSNVWRYLIKAFHCSIRWRISLLNQSMYPKITANLSAIQNKIANSIGKLELELGNDFLRQKFRVSS